MRGLVICLSIILLAASGCRRHSAQAAPLAQVVLYSDPEPYMTFRVAGYFGAENQIRVDQFQFNDYSGAKSTERLNDEQTHPGTFHDHPNADVYWSGDPIYCEILSQRGLTVQYRPTTFIPDAYRDSIDHWTGFAARARVLLVPSAFRTAERPQSVNAYTDPAWKGKGALADPLRGNSRSFFAALGVVWGDQKLAAFYRALRENGTALTGSDEESADLVVSGKAAFALVNTDLALDRIQKLQPLDIVYPDQGSGEPGVMPIPNAVTIMRGCKNLSGAQRLVDFLTSIEGERRIIGYSPWQTPLLVGIAPGSAYIQRLESVHVMRIDYFAAAHKFLDMEKILGADSKDQ